jgi:hypothetical protein
MTYLQTVLKYTQYPHSEKLSDHMRSIRAVKVVDLAEIWTQRFSSTAQLGDD